MQQLMLFADLEVPAPADLAANLPARYRIGAPWWVAVRALAASLQPHPAAPPAPEQLAIRAPLRELDRDDLAEAPPVHRVVAAADAEPLKTVAVSSIFGLAATVKALKRGRFGTGEQFAPAPYRVERDVDRVRVIRQRPEETAEWQEKERVRRAKQRPPKPTAKVRTRGKTVRRYDGEGHDD